MTPSESYHIFPKPTGPYAVGTTMRHIVDGSRRELHSDIETDNRELMIQLWYPAEENSAKEACPYAFDVRELWHQSLVKICREHNIDITKLNLIHKLKSWACFDTPIKQNYDPYPLVLFSPGLDALRTSYSVYCEELASHGYVVVGISHPYASHVVSFPNGRIVYGREISLDEPTVSEREQETWLRDVQFVLDQLGIINVESAFRNMLDLKNIGIFGHSFGGSTAIQAGRHDERILSCVNLDGALWGRCATAGFAKPCMIMIAAESIRLFQQDAPSKYDAVQNIATWRAIKSRYIDAIPQLKSAIIDAGGQVYTLTVEGANHNSFSDWILLTQLPLYA